MSTSNLNSNDIARISTDAIGTKVFQHRCLFDRFSLYPECFSCDSTAKSGPYLVKDISVPQPELELADVGRGIVYHAGQGTGSDPLSSHPVPRLRCSGTHLVAFFQDNVGPRVILWTFTWHTRST